MRDDMADARLLDSPPPCVARPFHANEEVAIDLMQKAGRVCLWSATEKVQIVDGDDEGGPRFCTSYIVTINDEFHMQTRGGRMLHLALAEFNGAASRFSRAG